MIKDFGKFLMRGNVADLSVAVVMGAAFGAVVTALVKNLLTPLIAAIFGQHDFSKIAFTINSSTFGIGDFINAAVNFFLVGFALYFFIVVPMNRIAPKPEDPKMKVCPECISDIPDAAKRCKFCTAQVT
jgi:large conductance mechanosensitive channel